MTETGLEAQGALLSEGQGAVPKLPCFVESRGSLHRVGWECEYSKGSSWAS